MLQIIPTAIPAVKVIVPGKFADTRGVFSETYNKLRFSEHGIDLEFVQDNESCSIKAGTVRGLHFQKPPRAQDKLIRVLHGRIFDVAVDLRTTSSTYGRWVFEELSADNCRQLLVPAGFAHGFCTLEPDTKVFYKVSDYYSSDHDVGVAWNDPDLAISWPVSSECVLLSEKDQRQSAFTALPTYFR